MCCPARQQRVAPYIYSPEEIAALMDAARDLWPPVRAATLRTAIGLLSASGMRIGEMLALDDGDLDHRGRCDHLRPGNGASSGRCRCTQRRCRRCAPTSDRATSTGRVRPTEALLITRHGDRLTKGAFLKAFRALLDQGRAGGRR